MAGLLGAGGADTPGGDAMNEGDGCEDGEGDEDLDTPLSIRQVSMLFILALALLLL